MISFPIIDMNHRITPNAETKKAYDDAVKRYTNAISARDNILTKYKSLRLVDIYEGKQCPGPDIGAKYNFSDGLCILGS
jgi:hypothetical protein